MRIDLPYGKNVIAAEIPFSNIALIEPRYVKGLADEAGEFIKALRNPVNARPLREIITASDRIAVLVPDITRPFPFQRVLAWFFKELSGVRAENFTIVVGTGSHRASTPAEHARMFGEDIIKRYRIVDHNAHDLRTMRKAGRRGDGGGLYLNREYVSAGKRVIMGFIEPHFMAGFSGGYKAVMPGVADIDSIMYYHRAEVIGDPRSTWGCLEGNPTQELIRDLGSMLPVDFCVNVAVNRERGITAAFCGETIAAHRQGCEYVKALSMIPCERRYPVVLTTNGGYPLDQNLYQSVKGMSAAAQIVADGGLIIMASECADGFPAHGNFVKLLFEHDSPRAILDTILKPGFSMFDQWEAQLLARIQVKTKVALFSALPADDVRRAHLEPVADLDNYLKALAQKLGRDTPVAVLPEGPLTIPYLGGK